MPGARWSHEDKMRLELWAGTKTLNEIARQLNRSIPSVVSAASRWGISTKQTLNNFSCEYVGNQLGCSPTTVAKWIKTGKLKAGRCSPKADYQIKLVHLQDFYRRWGDSRVFKTIDQSLLAWLLDFKDEEKMAKYQTMWTHEETETLLALAEQVPVERIAKKLNRSLDSVRRKAHYMGLSLRTVTDYLSTIQIAEILGCDRGAIVYWINKGVLSCRRSTRKTGQWRVSRRSLKELYKQKPNLRIWKEVPQENLDWLFK